MDTEFCFDTPTKAIGEKLAGLAQGANAAHVVSGFVTPDGLGLLPENLRKNKILQTLVVGAGTQRAFDALDELISSGFPRERVFVNLGYSRATKPGAAYSFLRYHPMLHSKIYLFERDRNEFAAMVGSANVTNFALSGLNGEACVVLRGKKAEPVYAQLMMHISACQRDSVMYDGSKKDAYAWWAGQYAKGLARKCADRDVGDYQRQATLVIVCEGSQGPKPGDTLYLELPKNLYQQRLAVDVHGYVFATLPKSMAAAVAQLSAAPIRFEGRVEGIVEHGGMLRSKAQWYIEGSARRLTKPISAPKDMKVESGFQQVLVTVDADRGPVYVYKHDREPTYSPQYGPRRRQVAEGDGVILKDLKIVPAEDLEWYCVEGLNLTADRPTAARRVAIEQGERHFMAWSPRRYVMRELEQHRSRRRT